MGALLASKKAMQLKNDFVCREASLSASLKYLMCKIDEPAEY